MLCTNEWAGVILPQLAMNKRTHTHNLTLVLVAMCSTNTATPTRNLNKFIYPNRGSLVSWWFFFFFCFCTHPMATTHFSHMPCSNKATTCAWKRDITEQEVALLLALSSIHWILCWSCNKSLCRKFNHQGRPSLSTKLIKAKYIPGP